MIGDQPTYLVQVRPVQEPDPKTYIPGFRRPDLDRQGDFSNRLHGITEPHGKQRVSTSRDLILENLRFPTTTTADGVLHFAYTRSHQRALLRLQAFRIKVNIVEVEKPESIEQTRRQQSAGSLAVNSFCRSLFVRCLRSRDFVDH